MIKMSSMHFNKIGSSLYITFTLLLLGCDQPYLSGKIELNFQNTTWHLENQSNLGVIHINKDATSFCIDRPLAEKLYPKDKLNSYKKNSICGDFKFDEKEHRVYFDLANYSYSTNVLRSPNDIYFMPVDLDVGNPWPNLIQKD